MVLQPAHRELPGQRAAADPSGDRRHQPRQQRGHPGQQQHQARRGQRHPLVLLQRRRVADRPEQHRQAGPRQQQPPPQPTPALAAAPDHAQRVDADRAHRQQRRAHRQHRRRDHHQRGQQRLRADVLGEEADALDAERLRPLPSQQEQQHPGDQPEQRPGQRLPGGCSGGHPPVRAAQPQRRQPPVALLPAETGRRAEEHPDRRQHHHETDQAEQQQHRGHRLARVVVAVLVDPHRPGAERQSVAAEDEGQLAGAEQPGLPDAAGDRVRQPLAQQRAPGALSSALSAGETTIFPGAG